jgi:hypothetical protein
MMKSAHRAKPRLAVLRSHSTKMHGANEGCWADTGEGPGFRAIAVGTTNKGKPAYFYEHMVGVLVGLEGALPLTSLW